MQETPSVRLSVPARNGGRPTPVYAVLPPSPTRAVVVIHEIMGPQPEIDRVVQRFASHGYAAAAPDLFAHSNLFTCVRRAMKAIHTGEGPQIEQLLDTRAWLCERTGLVPERVGIIGFCIGGGFALASGKGWGAVSVNYGDVPPEHVLRGIAPVIGCYGTRDVLFRGKAPVLEQRLTTLNIPHEVHTVEGVGHSFLTDGDHPMAALITRTLMHIEYNAAIAEESWGKILRFFDQHLSP